MQIVTFNVRGLNRIGQQPELTASAVEHNIDIVCLQEQIHHSEVEIKYYNTGTGWMFVSASAWKNSVNAVIGDAGMLLSPRALKSVNSFEKIQPRIMVATFNDNYCTTIISCYRPTNASKETDVDTFYNELSSFVRSIPKHNVLIIGGDMKAQIGKHVNNKFCVHNSSNGNREHQTGFILENRLTCLNSKFRKRKGKPWTYSDANNAKALIDYLPLNKKWTNSALNCKAYSSFEGVSPTTQLSRQRYI